jgi:hypothetical protein
MMMDIMSRDMVAVMVYLDEDVVMAVAVVIGIVSQNLSKKKVGMSMRTIMSFNTRRISTNAPAS